MQKPLAELRLNYGPSTWTVRGRREIAAWLRQQAKLLDAAKCMLNDDAPYIARYEIPAKD